MQAEIGNILREFGIPTQPAKHYYPLKQSASQTKEAFYEIRIP